MNNVTVVDHPLLQLLEGKLSLMRRNPETLMPAEYYFNAPRDLGERPVIVLDPMLATAGSQDVKKRRLHGRRACFSRARRRSRGSGRR